MTKEPTRKQIEKTITHGVSCMHYVGDLFGAHTTHVLLNVPEDWYSMTKNFDQEKMQYALSVALTLQLHKMTDEQFEEMEKDAVEIYYNCDDVMEKRRADEALDPIF